MEIFRIRLPCSLLKAKPCPVVYFDFKTLKPTDIHKRRVRGTIVFVPAT